VSLLAIIIPALKYSEQLRQCLLSLRRASCTWEREILVILNRAAHQEEDSLAEEEFPEVRFIVAGKNLGFSGGVNLGLRSVTAELYLLLNDDVELFSDSLSSLVQAFEKDPEIVVGGAKIYDPDGKTLQHCGGILRKNKLSSHIGIGEIDHGQYDSVKYHYDYLTGAVFAIRGSYYLQAGGFSDRYFPGYFEETEYCIRAVRQSKKIAFLPEVRAIHHESLSFKKYSDFFFYHYHKGRWIFIIRNFCTPFELCRIFREEWRWLRDCCPKEQRKPLLRAYIRTLLYGPFEWILGRFS